MKTKGSSIFICVVLSAFFMGTLAAATAAFALPKPLRTQLADPSEIKGTFTLMLYGGRYADDIETVAVMDLEGDSYDFYIFAPDYDYTVKKGLSAQDALERARQSVGFHSAFWRSQLSKIIDNQGNVIGYEVRPLYQPFVYGRSDVLDVNYWLKEGGKVKVTIKLIPSMERRRFPGGLDDSSGAH
ncbi:MAG: hypothetical protein AB1442_14050 [Nitrospirota bacterium]